MAGLQLEPNVYMVDYVVNGAKCYARINLLVWVANLKSPELIVHSHQSGKYCTLSRKSSGSPAFAMISKSRMQSPIEIRNWCA